MPRTGNENGFKRPILRSVIVPLITCFGLGLSIAVFLLARESESSRAESELRRRAELHYGALQISIQRDVEILEALRLFFETTTNISRRDFRTLVEGIGADHPAVQVIEWAPRVAAADRATLEADAAREIPGYQINDRDSNNRPFRAPERPEYYPLFFVEPVERNMMVPGFDAAAGKAAAELARARDTGETVISGVLMLPQSTNEPGLIVTLPVYDRPGLTTVADRRQHIRGVIRGVFRVRDLMEAAWTSIPTAGVDTLILDAGAPATNRFFYFHPSKMRREPVPTPTEAEMRGGVYHEVLATIGERRWVFLFRPVPEWWHAQVRRFPLGLLVTGVAFTLVLAAYLRAVLRRTEVIERAVADRTARLEQANTSLNHEIAERRRTEQDLRRSEARLLEAQRIGRIGSWEADLRGDTLSWSDEVYRIFGRDRTTFRPTHAAFYESIPANERAAVQESVRRAVTEGESYHAVHRIHRPDGQERIVVEHAEFVRDAAGSVVRLVGTVQDVTEQKRVEQRLAVERNLLESVVESLPDLIFVKDAEGRFIRANSAALQAFGATNMEDIIGRTEAEILPENMARLYPHDDEKILREGAAVLNREEPFRRRTGEQSWFLTTKVPFRDAEGRVAGLVGISRDITERKRQDEDRRAMERKFQETQKLESLGVLAGGIAHDFNNLLTGILGNASLARMDLPPESPIQAYMSQIEMASQRAAELCKQMLAYSGKGRFVIQPVDLSVLVQETLHLLQLSISKKAVLKIELAKGLPAVMGDTTQLRQIVMNLVINASDAIGDRSGLIILRTTRMFAERGYLKDLMGASDLPEGEYVVFEVTDNGCGMTDEVKNRIFEPFFTTKFTGRGLGLAAVLGIVRGHKGALKVYSELGKGTTFRLLLPSAGAPVREETAAPVAPAIRAAGRILIADDEQAVRTVVSRMCRSMGFEVLTANDGAQALEVFRASSENIDAVLLDLTMPQMDGEEAFREIRRLNPTAYVVLMSGFNEQDAVARFVGKGLAGFLQKPFTPDQLRAKLQSLFRG